MGKRFFQINTADFDKEGTNDTAFPLDEGAGTATADMRVVWDRGDGGQNFLDFFTEHPTDASEIGNRSGMSLTLTGGTNTGHIRINYEDTHGSDRVVAGIKAAREELEMRGRSVNTCFLSQAQHDFILKLLRKAEFAMASRGRAEGHLAANA